MIFRLTVILTIMMLCSIPSLANLDDDLFAAVKNDDVKKAKSLIANGADVNAKNKEGTTPLHYACLGGHIDLSKLLIVKGADENAKDNSGKTPLHYACLGGHTVIAKLLVDKGVDINAKTSFNWTPYGYALTHNYEELVSLLKEHGAKLKNPFDYSDQPLQFKNKRIANHSRIAYVSRQNGNQEIFTMKPDGTDIKQLTHSEGNESEPCWSPDGKYISFTYEENNYMSVYIMKSNGSHRKMVSGNLSAGLSSWSPNGKKLAYSVWEGSNWEIYTANVDGSKKKNISNNSIYTDTYPCWSPDGKKIAFHRNINENWEIFVMNSDGSNQKKLTDWEGEDWLPDWSPDGKHIAFWSTRTGDWELYIMDPDGSNQVQITDKLGHLSGGVAIPSWSPDSQYLVVSLYFEKSNHLSLVLIDRSAKVYRVFAKHDSELVDAKWSPVMKK